jgi:hypothetical protein
MVRDCHEGIMYIYLFLLTGVYVIHYLLGGFIVNIANIVIAWLVPSLSECSITYASPSFVSFHITKGDVYASLYELADLWTKPSAAWSLNGFSSAYGFRMCPVTL